MVLPDAGLRNGSHAESAPAVGNDSPLAIRVPRRLECRADLFSRTRDVSIRSLGLVRGCAAGDDACTRHP